jgi:hypothetical protein
MNATKVVVLSVFLILASCTGGSSADTGEGEGEVAAGEGEGEREQAGEGEGEGEGEPPSEGEGEGEYPEETGFNAYGQADFEEKVALQVQLANGAPIDVEWIAIGGAIDDLSPLRAIHSVETLIINNTDIVDTTGLEELTAIKDLSMSQNARLVRFVGPPQVTRVDSFYLDFNLLLTEVSWPELVYVNVEFSFSQCASLCDADLSGLVGAGAVGFSQTAECWSAETDARLRALAGQPPPP